MAKRVHAKTGSKRTASPKGARKAKATTAASKAKKATRKKKTTKKGATASSRTSKLASTRSTRSSKSATTTTKKMTRKKVAKKKKARTTAKRKTTTQKAANNPAKARRAAESTTHSVVQMPPEPRLPKTHLCDADLTEFKERLLRKRAELSGNVRELRRHAMDNKAQSGPEYSSMPIHMADLGSDNWEKEFTLGLIVNEQNVVREIDEALERISNKTYGVCLVTHKRITKARLRAKPWAKYCIQYALAREEGRAI